MSGFEAERDAAAAGIESLDIRAVYAGRTATASPEPSKVALLGDIDRCDALVLILGKRYGWISGSGLSPTEEEFNHACAIGKPVFVFVQSGVDFEEQQRSFIDRVGGGWTDGRFHDSFATPGELTTRVVSALNRHQARERDGDAVPAAQERARLLATRGSGSRGASANFVRVVLAPVGAGRLVTARVLDDAEFTDRVARAVRDCDLVPQASAIATRATSAGVLLTAKADREFHTTTVMLAADGSVTADLAVHGDGAMGSMVISYPRVREAVAATCRTAAALWAELPDADLFRQVAAVVSVPEPRSSPLSLSGRTGGSMRIPTFAAPPQAPDPPLVVRRADVTDERVAEELSISLKQAYADEGAVME